MMHGIGAIGGMSSGYMLAFGIGQLIVAGIVIFLIIKAVKKRKRRTDPALTELRLKFVNGDITEEEYNSKAKILYGK